MPRINSINIAELRRQYLNRYINNVNSYRNSNGIATPPELRSSNQQEALRQQQQAAATLFSPWYTSQTETPMATRRHSYTPYRTATSINEQGLPTGYINWQSYLQEMQHQLSERGGYAIGRLQDRIREAEDVINKNYASWDGRRRYTWSWERENMIKARKAVIGTGKSLFMILRFIQRNHKTLKTSSACWKWLNDAFLRIQVLQRPRKTNIMFYEDRFMSICNRFLKDCQLATVEDTTHPIILKRLVCSYYVLNVLYTNFLEGDGDFSEICITEALWEKYLAEGCMKQVDGKWYHTSCFFTTYCVYKNKDNKETYQISTEILNRNKHALCPKCEQVWHKKDIIYHPEVETSLCPKCKVTTKNKPHTATTLFNTYHSHRSSWQFLIRRKDKEQTLPMGIELEIHPRKSISSRNDVAAHIYRTQLELNPNWHEFYFETDGSLADGGMELITNPMTLEFARDYWEKMLPVVRAHFLGWKVKKVNGGASNNYGIHLTMSRRYWSNYQLARFIKFINSKNNQDFIWAIAQRNFAYSGGYLAAFSQTSLEEIGIDVGIKKKIMKSNSRYSPVNVKPSLVEVRMFASTLNQESFMKNYEFLDSTWHWIKETSWNLDYKEFLKWMISKREATKRWKNLVMYLHRDKFYVKQPTAAPLVITNNFLPMLKAQATSSLILQSVNENDPNDAEDLDQCAL